MNFEKKNERGQAVYKQKFDFIMDSCNVMIVGHCGPLKAFSTTHAVFERRDQ